MSYLMSLSIENYKGFYQKQLLEFAIPQLPDRYGLTIIVGPNNTGKSSIISALKLTKQNAKVPKNDRHNNDILKIEIVDSDHLQTVISNPRNDASLEISKTCFDFNKFEFIPSRTYWYGTTLSNPGEIDFHIRQVNENIDRTYQEDFFGDILTYLYEKGLYQQFNKNMKRIVPTFTDWKLEKDDSESNPYFKYETGGNDSHKIVTLGDGLFRLFRIVAYLTINSNKRILLIDEPELSLHPQVQKRLFKFIKEVSKDKQIIITTNSPYFVDWDTLKYGKVVRCTKHNDNNCTINSINDLNNLIQIIESIDRQYHAPYLLDDVAKEIFFSEKILFTEGKDDVGLLKQYLDGREIEYDIFGYGVDGYNNLHHFVKFAFDLGIKTAVLIDKPRQEVTHINEQLSGMGIKNTFIIELPTYDIIDKTKCDSKNKICEKEVYIDGIFDVKGKIKTQYIDFLENMFNDLDKFFKNNQFIS